jgi:hypothetical protein
LIANTRRTDLVIPDIVLLEISYLSAKGRIGDADGLDVPLGKVAESFRLIPTNPDIARLALEIDLPRGGSFGRVITATAKARVPALGIVT